MKQGTFRTLLVAFSFVLLSSGHSLEASTKPIGSSSPSTNKSTQTAIDGSGQRLHSPETYPWGIEFLVCVAGAKLSGASMGDAMSQCTARVP